MQTRLVPITILLLAISVISGITLLSSQITFAQQTENNTNPEIDITKLTGDENVVIIGNISAKSDPAPINEYNAYKFDTKPIIKINGQDLDYEYPIVTYDVVTVEDTVTHISMKTKFKLSETETKILNVGSYAETDIIKENPDGSKTYINKPGNGYITIGDGHYTNISSVATINEDRSKGFIKAETN